MQMHFAMKSNTSWKLKALPVFDFWFVMTWKMFPMMFLNVQFKRYFPNRRLMTYIWKSFLLKEKLFLWSICRDSLISERTLQNSVLSF